MSGLEAVEAEFSILNEERRIDAQYFKKKYLKEDSRRRHYVSVTLGSQTFITDGPHGYHVVDEKSSIAMLTAKCAKNWFASKTEADRIAAETHNANLRSSLEKDDLILSTRGTVGLCALVEEKLLPSNIDQDVARISIKKDSCFQPKFLLAYINSYLGQDWIARNLTGMVQQGLSLEKVRNLPIPTLSDTFQSCIANIIDVAIVFRNTAEQKLRDAETTLLRALGIENWQAPESLSYVRDSRDVFAAERLDAEHYQPKFDEVLLKVRQTETNLIPLGKIIRPIKNGFDARDFVEDGTPYIRVGDIKDCDICLESAAKVAMTSEEINKNITLAVGDVLFTRKGTFGNAAPVFAEHTSAIISSEIMLLRLDHAWQGKILPEFLALFFNSLFGKMQAEKWAHGVAFYSVAQDDLQRFLVPVIDLEKQVEIERLFHAHKQKNTEAFRLLESAKRAVEIAIEESEASAEKWLREVNARVE
ncbi:MAG: restriction endonuclease subunit S [Synergistaceae bacterium]|jgi:type I restriction enzyme M protein|nr:restriction endonuclease subunit S [Synergistaceae bacterium]